MAEFVPSGYLRAFSPDIAARRIILRAITAITAAPRQPLTRSPACPTQAVLAYLLTRAGVPLSRAAEALRVSEQAFDAELAFARDARRDKAFAAWLDGLVAAMEGMNPIAEMR